LSVKASCSRCDFSRRFSDELGGRYYRCPKCRKGVIAVPEVDPSVSEEVPLRLSSTSMENPFLDVAKRLSAGQRETLEMTAVGSTAEGTRLGDPPGDSSSLEAAPAAKPMQETLADSSAEEERVDNRGQVTEVRRILVECGLCGFLVRIPAEFFGKTVHCPECAGNAIFTESTLDPVKDELLDRLIMETGERKVLFPTPSEVALPAPLRALRAAFGRTQSAFKSFLVGVGLGLVVLVCAWALVRSQRASERAGVVKQAERDGWRYATAIDAPGDVVHEPWCSKLDSGLGRRISGAQFEEAGESLKLHACD
jgi:hypothetical protein